MVVVVVIESFEQLNQPENKILGVEVKELKTFDDQRGFFREIIRANEPQFNGEFAQWSHSKMAKNTVKAWHFHHKQIDWWYVGLGLIHTVLFDNRKESSTFGKKLEFFMGDSAGADSGLCALVRIPQGVLHGLKVLSDSAHLFYITSCTYDPQDEGRLPFNSDVVGQNWGDESSLIVADNDRKTLIPPYPRQATS
ncbi:hypothetical protein BVY02_01280 [bacterium J17]|nr:hypothetical protein BVY02_01280 [bacterium J17]